jgi:hypothetical protein
MAIYEVRINGKVIGSQGPNRSKGYQWANRRDAIKVARTNAQTQWYYRCKDSDTEPCPGGAPLLVLLGLSNKLSWGVTINRLEPSLADRARKRFVSPAIHRALDLVIKAMDKIDAKGNRFPDPIN